MCNMGCMSDAACISAGSAFGAAWDQPGIELECRSFHDPCQVDEVKGALGEVHDNRKIKWGKFMLERRWRWRGFDGLAHVWMGGGRWPVGHVQLHTLTGGCDTA